MSEQYTNQFEKELAELENNVREVVLDATMDDYEPSKSEIHGFKRELNQFLGEHNLLPYYQLQEAEKIEDVYQRIDDIDALAYGFQFQPDEIIEAEKKAIKKQAEQEREKQKYKQASWWQKPFLKKPDPTTGDLANISPATAITTGAAVAIGMGIATYFITGGGTDDEPYAPPPGNQTAENDTLEHPGAHLAIDGHNTPPVQVSQGTELLFNASQSEGDLIWRILEPDEVVWPGNHTQTMQYLFNETGPHTIQLLAYLNGEKDIKSVEIDVKEDLPDPQLDFEEGINDHRRYLFGTPIEVSGANSSSPNGNITEYLWKILYNPNKYEKAMPPVEKDVWHMKGKEISFTPPYPGSWAFQLTVKDETGAEDTSGLGSFVPVKDTVIEEPAIPDDKYYLDLDLFSGRGALVDYDEIYRQPPINTPPDLNLSDINGTLANYTRYVNETGNWLMNDMPEPNASDPNGTINNLTLWLHKKTFWAKYRHGCDITPQASQIQFNLALREEESKVRDPTTGATKEGAKLDVGGDVLFEYGTWFFSYNMLFPPPPYHNVPVLQWNDNLNQFESDIDGYPDDEKALIAISGKYRYELDGEITPPRIDPETGILYEDKWDGNVRASCDDPSYDWP